MGASLNEERVDSDCYSIMLVSPVLMERRETVGPCRLQRYISPAKRWQHSPQSSRKLRWDLFHVVSNLESNWDLHFLFDPLYYLRSCTSQYLFPDEPEQLFWSGLFSIYYIKAVVAQSGAIELDVVEGTWTPPILSKPSKNWIIFLVSIGPVSCKGIH